MPPRNVITGRVRPARSTGGIDEEKKILLLGTEIFFLRVFVSGSRCKTGIRENSRQEDILARPGDLGRVSNREKRAQGTGKAGLDDAAMVG